MLIVHAGYCGDALLLWGEAATGAPPRPARRRGRRPRRPRPEPLPFAAGPEDLLRALERAGIRLGLGPADAVDRVAWLPAEDGIPIPSSPLIGELPERDAPASMGLFPWRVPAFPLRPSEALDLLAGCAGGPLLAPGVVAGRDLAFWVRALAFAASLTARQRFLPGLQEENGRWHARWQPVMLGPDAEHLARLRRAMPGAAAALAPEAAEGTRPGGPPRRPDAELLTAFVGRMVDHLVRSAAGPAPAAETAAAPPFHSLHEQWLHALTAGDGRMTGEDGELRAFAGQVRAWQRPVALLSGAPFRLCFRLEEPAAPLDEADGDPAAVADQAAGAAAAAGREPAWRVRFLLQAADEPSLMVPVPDALRRPAAVGAPARAGAPQPADVREFVLSALGQAARLWPDVEQGLRGGPPAGYALDTAGAHRFLTEAAPVLQQAGFVVLLPAWWTGAGSRLRLAARAAVRSPGLEVAQGLGLDAIVEVDWQVALGDQALTRTELERLAKLKAPLVRFRGQWVQVGADELRTAQALLRRGATEALSARQVLRLALEGGARPAPDGSGGARGVPTVGGSGSPLAVEGVSAGGWVGELLAALEDGQAFAPLEPPAGLRGTLRPYQVRGYSWLAFLRRFGLGACLADDMGLGKTVQTLALLQRDRELGSPGPVLLVCPTSVVQNWRREVARFTPDLPVLVHHGVARLRGDAFTRAAPRHALVVTTYGLLVRDQELLRRVAWAGVVLDEAQHVKNPETRQARAARSLGAGFRVALTGTPVENHVGDLWSIMEFLNPGLLGGLADFRRRFFVPIQVYRDAEAAARLGRLVGPFVLRRLKTDRNVVSDLPDKIEARAYCTLTREQASLYRAVLKEAEAALDAADGVQRRGVVLATLSKLKQVCNHPAQFLGDNSALAGRSGKLARLTELCEELLAAGGRALIFTQFARMGELLQRYLQETFGREVLFLHGGLPRPRRDRLLERFERPDGPPLFVLSLKAGGTGLNLTAANHVFHFDRWWNPAVETQATDRAFRIGQTRRVQVHKFVCAGTVEEKIDDLIERKQALADRLVGSGEAWLTELSTAELRGLFKLEAGAVEA